VKFFLLHQNNFNGTKIPLAEYFKDDATYHKYEQFKGILKARKKTSLDIIRKKSAVVSEENNTMNSNQHIIIDE
jgi:hypothetical protein